MKLIFLDIDGVLNNRNTKEKCGSYSGIDESMLKLFKNIIDKTGAKVVLISSWKEKWFQSSLLKDKQDELANYLDKRFQEYNLVVFDKLHDYGFLSKSKTILEQIRVYSKNYEEVTNYIILDDHSFDYCKTSVKSHFILIKNGLNETSMISAIDKLNNL